MKWLRDELVRHFEQLETERETLRARVAVLEAEVARLKAPKPVISVETGRADE